MKARVVIPVNALKKTANGVLKKLLKPNSIVTGGLVEEGMLPENRVVLFKTNDGYLIPTHCIMQIHERNKKGTYESFDDIQEAEEVEEDEYVDKEKINELKENGVLNIETLINGTKKETKYITNGAIAGGLAMLIFAMYKGKSKLLFSFVGILGGGYLGKMYSKHIG
tara:strand:+ start:238 stop:738 length:501 start_codon:yes stop_codon:yes gene_type:complete